MSPEKSGREYLKQKIKLYGINPALFPDAALNEIVSESLLTAKGMTSLKTMMPEFGNWRANLVRQLDGKAVEIFEIMLGSKSGLAIGKTKDTLVKYGVVKS